LLWTDASPNKAEPDWRETDDEAVEGPDAEVKVLRKFREVSNGEQEDF